MFGNPGSILASVMNIDTYEDHKGKVHEKEEEKKLTSVSFMYVCVADNAELLFFFTFFAPSP